MRLWGQANRGRRTDVRKEVLKERPMGFGHQLDVRQEREMEESKKAPNLQVQIQEGEVSMTREGDDRNTLTELAGEGVVTCKDRSNTGECESE